jgi:TonB-dependent receptor
VKGVRSTIETAAQIKRESDTIEEAITSIDIGEWVDDSIAQALQRVPGVQIEVDDTGTDGDRVSIRGMGPSFVNGTINNRVLLSPGTQGSNLRRLNFNVYPPNVLSGVRVAKMQTASRPESGMAGSVNLETLRPLDQANRKNQNVFGSLTLQGDYQDVSEDSSSRVNAILGGRNAAGNLGAYISLAVGDTKAARDQLGARPLQRDILIDNDGDGTADVTMEDVFVPHVMNYSPIREERKRTAYSAGIQFQPTDEFDIVIDGTYTEFDSVAEHNRTQLFFGNAWFRNQVWDADGIDIDEHNTVRFADFSQVTGNQRVQQRLAPLQFRNVTENVIVGANVDWSRDRWNINFDLYTSTVDYLQDLRFPFFRQNLDTPAITYDARNRVPTVQLGSDYTDPSTQTFFNTTIREIYMEGETIGGALAFEYDLDLKALSTLRFGYNHSETDIDFSIYNKPAGLPAPDSDTVVAAGITGQLWPGNFLDGLASPGEWFRTDFAAMAEIEPWFLLTGKEELAVDQASAYHADEILDAFYGQLDFDAELRGAPFTGNVGLRAVRTENISYGSTRNIDNSFTPTTTSFDYWEYLPSINTRWVLTPTNELRFGYSKTLTRPEYSDTAPVIRIRREPEIDPGSGDETVGLADAGNAELDPITADNFDITYGWYPENGSNLVVSLFYKDVSNFIVEETVENTTVPGQDGLFDVTQPINFSEGEVKGYEIGFYLPGGALHDNLVNFGISGNYTYVDGEFQKNVGDAGVGFPGNSEDNYNLTAFWETEKWTARLAYTYRGPFLRDLAGTSAQTVTARHTGEQENVTANLKYRPTDALTLSFNVNNLTDERRHDYVGTEATYLAYFYRGRTYALTATYSFDRK